jgi:hypothetical protein
MIQFCIKMLLPGLLVSVVACGQPGSLTGDTDAGKKAVYDSLATQLVHIDHDDQQYRQQMDAVISQYGGDSPEMITLVRRMHEADSVNLIKVSEIIDTYGWLGPDAVGHEGSLTLFMVIQHAPLAAQEKYLPVMRQAVKDGRARAASLAMLEDRVALRKGGKQTFGSQVSWDMKNGTYYVLPLDDPDHVDKRRAEVGLAPLAEYLMNCCNLVWDAEAYKKDIRYSTGGK